ncbi:hypothetical protein ACTFIU_004285 [Dictyostelium citrinum]
MNLFIKKFLIFISLYFITLYFLIGILIILLIIMYCGYIYKLGQFIYKKRYFEIINDHDQNLLENQKHQSFSKTPTLCYYDNEKKKNKRGSIEIQDILYFYISKEFAYNRGNVFGFELTTPGCVYYFYTNTESERIYWIEAITTISSKLKQNKIDKRINDSIESTNFSPKSPQLSIKNDDDEGDNQNGEKIEQINNIEIKKELNNHDNHIHNNKETINEIFNLIDNLNNKKVKLLNYKNKLNIEIINKLNIQNSHLNHLNEINKLKNQIIEIQFKINSTIHPLLKSELKSIKIFLNGSINNSFINTTISNDESKLIEIVNQYETINENKNNNEEVEIKENIKFTKDQLIIKKNILKEEINQTNNNITSSFTNFNILCNKISQYNTNNKIINTINNYDENMECNEIKKCNILEVLFKEGNINQLEEFERIKEETKEIVNDIDKKIIIIENKIKTIKDSVINSSENQQSNELQILINEIKDYRESTMNHYNYYINFIKQVLLLKNQCKCLKLQPKSITSNEKHNISQLDLMVETLIKKHNNFNIKNNNNNNYNNGRCYSVGSERSSTESIRSTLTSSLSNLSVSSPSSSSSSSSSPITPTLNPSGKWVLPSNFKKISTGLYQFGTKRINASIRDSDGNLVVRVGGGYLLFVDFVYKYGERESLKLKSLQKTI